MFAIFKERFFWIGFVANILAAAFLWAFWRIISDLKKGVDKDD